MWIFLGIVAFLAGLITVVLLLPVHVIIKNDEDNNMILRYKILFKTLGEDPDPNNPIAKAIKKSSGISRIEKKNLERNIEQSGFSSTVKETFDILVDLLREVVAILKYCTAKKFMLHIVCSAEDAADAAVSFGECCAVAYPAVGAVCSAVKVPNKARDIDIRCDYLSKKDIFRYDFDISVRVFRVLAAFFRIALAEARRSQQE